MCNFFSFSFLSDFLDIYVLVPRSDTFAALLIWKYILTTGLVTEEYIPAIDIFISYLLAMFRFAFPSCALESS